MPETYIQKQRRYAQYRRLEVAKKILNMDDDTFRALLVRCSDGRDINFAGVPSRTLMDQLGLHKAVEEMKRLGFKPICPSAPSAVADIRNWRRPLVNKICAIWIAMHQAGVVNNRSEAAMITWCAKVTKKNHLQWMTKAELNQCIEGLKRWAKREKVTLRG